MPDITPGGQNISDAARLSRSYAEIYAMLDAAARRSDVFFPRQGVGFSSERESNPYLFIRDYSASEVVVGCYGYPQLFRATYTIGDDGAIAFGKPAEVAERFVPVEGEEITDAIASEPEEFEILDADKGVKKLRILSTKANTVINGRVYPASALRQAVDELREDLKRRPVFSEVPHPKPIKQGGKVVGFQSNDKRRVSRIVDVEMTDRGEVYAVYEFLENALGAEVYASYVNRTGEYGVSQRAIGRKTTKPIRGQELPVFTTIKLHTFDFVPNPALKDSISRFEVLLDSELEPEDSDPQEAPGAPEPVLDAGFPAPREEETTTMPDINPTVGTTPAAATPAPAAPTVTPEVAQAMIAAAAIIQADADRKAAEQARAEVKAYATSDEVSKILLPFPDPARAAIVERVTAAANRGEAERVLASEVELTSRVMAVAKAEAIGFGQPTAGAGATTATAGQSPEVTVVSNPTPHLEVAKRFSQHIDDMRAERGNFVADPGLREHNQKFINTLMSDLEKATGTKLTEGAEAILDSAEGWDVLVDSTNTSSLWNQPTIIAAILQVKYQDLEMLAYAGGIGKSGFERVSVNGEIGSVLRVPTEVYGEPTGSLALPGYDSSLFSAEDAEINESGLTTAWQDFAPDWRKIACDITLEAQKAMQNGPLQLDALARLTYHMIQDMNRRIDRALAEEMLMVADEFDAVAVASETVASGNLVQNTSTTKKYGTTVTYYANIVGAGSAATPGNDPIVRRRKKVTMSAAGVVSSSIANQVSVSGGTAGTHVEGYLDGNGDIQPIPGVSGTVTFAVDYANGRICFNAASGVDGTHLPTLGYTYVTNYDTFSPTVPNGVENAVYYNRLLEKIDSNAALMGSYPRYNRPNLVLGSLNAMVKVENAQLFYQIASPKGTNLIPATRGTVAERGGLAYAKHNTPWSAGDGRLLLTKAGSTRYGVDTPFQMEGPYPSYGPNGKLKSNKKMMGAENSVICTPQATDQSGTVRNPVARSLYLR